MSLPATSDAVPCRRLLSAARDMFARKGYTGTTVREIVASGGVTKPVLIQPSHYRSRSNPEIHKSPKRILVSLTSPYLAALPPRECTPGIFDALGIVVSKGKESLSDGLRELVRNLHRGVVGIGDLFWPEDEPDRVEAENRILLLPNKRICKNIKPKLS